MYRTLVGVLALGATTMTMPLVAAAAGPSGERGDRSVAESTEPARVADVKRGQRVRLAGVVVRVIDRDEFRLADGTGSIPVCLPWSGQSLVNVGDEVVVDGIVDDDMTFGLTRPEVYATSIRLPGGATMSFAAPEADGGELSERRGGADDSIGATAIAMLARGQAATVSGRVVHMLDADEFRLEDESGSVRVTIGWQHRMPVQIGDRVTVAGVLDDDPWPMRPEFYADTITLADGRAFDVRSLPHEIGSPDGGTASGDGSAESLRPEARTAIGALRPLAVVLVEGVVDRITDEDEFRIRDDSGSVRVYIGWRNRMPVREGDRVSVVGMVDGDGPGGLFREIYAFDLTTADGRVIELQANRVSPVIDGGTGADSRPEAPGRVDAGITSIVEVRRGQSVALRGEVVRIRDTDEFVLRDDTGSITIYIGWRNRMPVGVGDRITVFGTADDDVLPGVRPEVYAERIMLADGRLVTLVRGGYDD